MDYVKALGEKYFADQQQMDAAATEWCAELLENYLDLHVLPGQYWYEEHDDDDTDDEADDYAAHDAMADDAMADDENDDAFADDENNDYTTYDTMAEDCMADLLDGVVSNWC